MVDSEDTKTLTDLMKLPENSLCADCDNENPDWVSISHAWFICKSCALVHKKIENQIVKPCNGESLDDIFMTILSNGGNAKLHLYFQQYDVAKETPILFKYNTKAAKRYRTDLLANVSKLQEELPSLAVSEGSELCEGIEVEPTEQVSQSKPTLMAKFKEYATSKLNKSQQIGNKTYRQIEQYGIKISQQNQTIAGIEEKTVRMLEKLGNKFDDGVLKIQNFTKYIKKYTINCMRDTDPQPESPVEPSQMKLDASNLRESEENGEQAPAISEFYDITPN